MTYIVTLSNGQRVRVDAHSEFLAADAAREIAPALHGGRSQIASVEPADKRTCNA